MYSIQYYGNLALKLYDNGYIPIPIIPSINRLTVKNWPSIKNDYSQISKLTKNYPHACVDVLLNKLFFFDIDILDEKLSLLESKFISNLHLLCV